MIYLENVRSVCSKGIGPKQLYNSYLLHSKLSLQIILEEGERNV